MNFLKFFFKNKHEKKIEIIKNKFLKNFKYIEKKLALLSNDELREKTFFYKKLIKKSIKIYLEKKKKIKYKLKFIKNLKKKERYFEKIKIFNKKISSIEKKILLNILPEAFLVVKETAKRFKKNKNIIVNATKKDIFFAKKKSYVKIFGSKAIWKNSWSILGKKISWNMVHYEEQIIGGIVLHEGKIAEMATGEGKTLVATLPIYLNALLGKGVHVITVNDYLSKRDYFWMAPIMEFHGLIVDCIDLHTPGTIMRKNAYKADITYGTNNEFGFDYLRDNIVFFSKEVVQRKLNYAILDEIDSVLIDDARTPLIISGPSFYSNKNEFEIFKPKIEKIFNKQCLKVEKFLKEAKILIKSGKIKDGGIKLLQIYRGLPSNENFIKFLSKKNIRSILEDTELEIMKKYNNDFSKIDSKLYFVIDERNNIIEFSEKGIEFLSKKIKDNDFFIIPDVSSEIITINNKNISKGEKMILKGISFRNFYIKSDRIHIINQLLKAYTLFKNNIDYIILNKDIKIVDQKTGRILKGRRYSDGIHQALEAKENIKIENTNYIFAYISLQNYFRMYQKLSGMTGTAEYESLEFWKLYKLDVVVIPTNKKIIRKDFQDRVFKTKREKYNEIIKEIIYISKKKKRPVLVGTNSIKESEKISNILNMKNIIHNVLNAKFHEKEAEIISQSGKSGIITIATNMAGRGTDIKISPKVAKIGGLAVIGIERNESRRVDIQLIGRSGRQGDPGSSQFYVSLEDNLMRIFGLEKMAKIIDSLGHKEGEDIQNSLIIKCIENAQKKVEENNFLIRKYLLEYDDVINIQRKIIYNKRRKILFKKHLNLDINIIIFNVLNTLFYKPKYIINFQKFKKKFFKIFSIYPYLKEKEFFLKKKKLIIYYLYKYLIFYFFKIKEKNLKLKISYIREIIFKNKIEKIRIRFTDGLKSIFIKFNYLENKKIIDNKILNQVKKISILNFIDDNWKLNIQKMDNLRISVQNFIYEQKNPLTMYKEKSFKFFKKSLEKINENISFFLFRMDLPKINFLQKENKIKKENFYIKNVYDSIVDNFLIEKDELFII